MEVVGAIASIVALIEVGKKLKDCVDKIPTNQRRLQDVAISINQDLESLHDLIQNCQTDIGAQTLRDAISSLEADLQNGLGKCQKMLRKFGWLRQVMIWKDSDDIEAELVRIEQRVANCYRRFSTSSIARVELSVVDIARMQDQLHAEMNHRLDVVENHLQSRVMKKGADLADVEPLVGASIDLGHHSPTLPESLLRLKVETLTSAVELLPTEEIQQRPPHSFSGMAWSTHYSTMSDPAEQTEYAIVKTLQILRALRTRESSAPVMQIAGDLEDLSIQLLDLGMYEDARQTYMQVVRIYRGSIAEESRPAIIDAMVARALIGVSTSLRHLGKSQVGLEPIREAWSIFRRLEDAHPAAFRHELALALNNMANHLRDSGLYTDAMTAANEAVELRRQLAIESPDTHKANLAASLLNASSCYSMLVPMKDKALATVVEAVSLSRELVANQPEAFKSYLGACLHNAANCHAALHYYTSAYTDIREAVGIRSELAIARPSVFSNGLRRSLTVATMLALKCGDTFNAAQFDAQRQHPTTAHGLPIPAFPLRLSSAYTPHTALNQVISLGMRSCMPGPSSVQFREGKRSCQIGCSHSGETIYSDLDKNMHNANIKGKCHMSGETLPIDVRWKSSIDTPAPLNELGKGVSLYSVPASLPLYTVEFKAGRTDLFYLTDLSLDIRVGDFVIVEADRGKDLGKVVKDSITLKEVEEFQREQPARVGDGDGDGDGDGSGGGQSQGAAAKKGINPKMIYGKAQGQDTQLLMAKIHDEVRALQLCQSKVRQKKLPMEVIDAEYQWDRRKLTFYFVAEKRIDFRELVRELFRLYKTRIRMASLQGPTYDR